MITKKIKIVLMVAIVLLLIVGCAPSEEEIVAKVNDKAITFGQLDELYSVYMAAMPDIGIKEQEMKEVVLDDMIRLEVIKQYLSANNIEVESAEIEEEYKNYMEQVASNSITKEFFEKNNISEAFVKEYIIGSYLYDIKFYDKVTSEVKNEEEAAIQYYNNHKDEFTRVRASHILVKKKKEAQKIMDKIKSGEDFTALAKEYSIDGSAQNGGDLDYFPKGKMVKPFEDAAFALEIGEVSDIVETDYGFHIIKLTDKITDAFEEIKDYVVSVMYNDIYQTKLEEIKAEMEIVTYPKKLS
ncbi:MAG: hypothetical protein GX285_06165 [Clostridiales bacterium]|nr:hypothetical protein [Clostridiales bacterium]